MRKAWLVLIGVLGVAALPFGCILVVSRFIPPGSPTQPASASQSSPDIRSRSATTTPAPTPAPALPLSKWKGGSEGRSKMDDRETVTYSVGAENHVTNWLSRRDRPRLAIRCRGSKTELMIDTTASAQPTLGMYNRVPVRVRLDDRQPERQVWNEGTRDEVLFAPNAIGFARRLLKARELRFEYTPLRMAAQVITFDVRGLDMVIDQVAKPCGWKP